MLDILNLRYSDLLTFLGLTNIEFTFLAVLIILITFLICLLIKLGVFKKLDVYRDTRNPIHIIYRSYQGDYRNIKNEFEKIQTHMQGLFAISRTFGIYYDDPKIIQDKNLCRAVIGILVNQGQADKVTLFMDNYLQYNEVFLPKSKYLVTQFPYLNVLSQILINFKVHPVLKKRCQEENQKGAHNKKAIVVQIYHFLQAQGKIIEIMAPLQNLEQFFLWEERKKDI